MVLGLTKVSAQSTETLTLEFCYSRATENYPLIRQRELIEKTKEYSISNAAKGFLPVITLNAQLSYQSDVTKVPTIEGQNMNIPVLSKNQYKVYSDITAPIYDGGMIKQEKQLHEANAKIETQKLEAELYQLKDRVNQVFFGILLLEGQLVQNDLLRSDVELGLRKTRAAIANGTALKSSADILQAELLKTNQGAIELSATRTAYLDALGMLVGQTLNENTVLEKPKTIAIISEINRPELRLYDYQSNAIDVQNKMLSARNRPKLSSFLQFGYGRPGLNMLNTQADSYYIGGLRINWTISGLYTFKKEKELLEINRKNIAVQKETFLFNTNYTLKQQNGEVNKLQQLLATDEEIISLRSQVKNTASAQLENGVIDANDYLEVVSDESHARQNKVLHEVELLMSQYKVQTTAGIQ